MESLSNHNNSQIRIHDGIHFSTSVRHSFYLRIVFDGNCSQNLPLVSMKQYSQDMQIESAYNVSTEKLDDKVGFCVVYEIRGDQ